MKTYKVTKKVKTNDKIYCDLVDIGYCNRNKCNVKMFKTNFFRTKDDNVTSLFFIDIRVPFTNKQPPSIHAIDFEKVFYKYYWKNKPTNRYINNLFIEDFYSDNTITGKYRHLFRLFNENNKLELVWGCFSVDRPNYNNVSNVFSVNTNENTMEVYSIKENIAINGVSKIDYYYELEENPGKVPENKCKKNSCTIT